MKEKHLRNNENIFMNKSLHKAIMTRSRLLNKYREQKTENKSFRLYKKRNLCAKLLRKTKMILMLKK